MSIILSFIGKKKRVLPIHKTMQIKNDALSKMFYGMKWFLTEMILLFHFLYVFPIKDVYSVK